MRPPLIIVAHRILIGSAIVFGVFLTAWETVQYHRTGAPAFLLVAVLAGVVTVALAYYLKNLRRFVR